MKRLFVMVMLTLVPVAGANASKTPKKVSEETALATVNGERITIRDVLEAFTRRHSGHARFLGGTTEARTFLKMLIDERLLVQEAFELGLDQDATVQRALGEYEAAQTGKELIRTEIEEKAKPTPEEVRAIWAGPLRFFVHARQITVDTRQEADEIHEALLRGGDFDALARMCSRADSRSRGGYVLVKWGQLAPEWEQAVFSLEPGEISPVIDTPDGFDVVIAGGRIDVLRPPELSKVSAEIEAILRQRKLEERKRGFSQELWRKYNVVLQPLDGTPAALTQILATKPDMVVATWNGGTLTVKQAFSEGELRMLSMFPPLRARREIEARIRATVNDPLVTLEARERKLAERPQIARNIGIYRDAIMQSVLHRDHIFRDVAAKDDEVRRYYESHGSEFQQQEERHVAHIVLSTEEEAASVRELLLAGGNFEELAKKHSRDASTSLLGGDLGWITEARVPPAFAEVMKMNTGDYSKPIKSNFGWHIIRLIEVKPRRQLDLKEARGTVEKAVLDRKQREERTRWLEKLRAAATIRVDDAAIQAFVRDHQFNPEATPPQHGAR